MNKPIAIFGLPEKPLVEKIMNFRRQMFKKRQIKTIELKTVPHLTMAVTREYPEHKSIDKLVSIIEPLVNSIKKFTLKITNFEILKDNIIARFDNRHSKKIVSKFDEVLKTFQLNKKIIVFKPITTEYMKILRRVKPGYLNEALSKVSTGFPKIIKIEKVCIAGKMLRKEDILWEKILTD